MKIAPIAALALISTVALAPNVYAWCGPSGGTGGNGGTGAPSGPAPSASAGPGASPGTSPGATPGGATPSVSSATVSMSFEEAGTKIAGLFGDAGKALGLIEKESPRVQYVNKATGLTEVTPTHAIFLPPETDFNGDGISDVQRLWRIAAKDGSVKSVPQGEREAAFRENLRKGAD